MQRNINKETEKKNVSSDFFLEVFDLISIIANLVAVVEALDIMCIAWPQIRG